MSGPTRIVHSSQQVSNRPPDDAGRRRTERPWPQSTVEDKASGDPTPASAIELPDTRSAGLYRLAWDEGSLGAQQDLFASNPDPREIPLDRLSTADDLKKLVAPLKIDVAVAKGDGTDAPATTGREVWHEMAWGLLGLLILEPILAAVGRSVPLSPPFRVLPPFSSWADVHEPVLAITPGNRPPEHGQQRQAAVPAWN